MLRGLNQITTQCSDSKARKSQKAFGALIFDGTLHIMPFTLPRTCLLVALSRVVVQDGFLAMYDMRPNNHKIGLPWGGAIGRPYDKYQLIQRLLSIYDFFSCLW